MLYKKEGMPEEGELVVVTVTKIHPTSVFAKLEHYDDKFGILHISEIAPGRIRNLNEYVSIGKTLVVQVLHVSKHRGNIDLSLRRVSEARRIKKMSSMKQELKAEKLIEAAAEELKGKTEDLYKKIADKVFGEYMYIHSYFMDLVQGEADWALMGLPKKQLDVLKEIITQRIKPPVMEIAGEFNLKSHAGNGLEVVSGIVSEAQKVSDAMVIKYGGAGAYPFLIQTESFEEAEEILEKTVAVFERFEKDKLTEFSFTRKEGKQVEQ